MAKRYYVAQMDPVSVPMGRSAWSPAVAKYPGRWASVTVTDPTSGTAWALCVVEAADHTAIAADPDCAQLPATATLDDALSTVLTVNQFGSFQNKLLSRFGISLANLGITRSSTFRQLIRALGGLEVANFAEMPLDGAVA